MYTLCKMNMTLNDNPSLWRHRMSFDRDYIPASRMPLPLGMNIAERPVWEPPVLDYHGLIGEEYEQKRKAVLKYYKNDVKRTTLFLDAQEEFELLEMYLSFVEEELKEAISDGDSKREGFFRHLADVLDIDFEAARDNAIYDDDESWEYTLYLARQDDGIYQVVKCFEGEYYAVSDCLERIGPDSKGETDEGASSTTTELVHKDVGLSPKATSNTTPHNFTLENLPSSSINNSQNDINVSETPPPTSFFADWFSAATQTIRHRN